MRNNNINIISVKEIITIMVKKLRTLTNISNQYLQIILLTKNDLSIVFYINKDSKK